MPPTEAFKALAKVFVFVHVDVDENEADARKFGVSSIPDFRVLKADGSEVAKWVGYSNPDAHIAKMVAAQKAAGK